MWSALEGSLLLWSLLLCAIIVLVLHYYRRRSDDPVVVLGRRGALRCERVLPRTHVRAGRPVHPQRGEGPAGRRAQRAACRTTRSSRSTRRCSTWASSASPCPSPSPSRCSSPDGCTTAGRSSSAAGRCSPGACSRSASCSARGGATRCSGWGGFWGWDPVENAALLPWLTATAYVHSVIVQDRRGLFRVWNLSLAIATFALTILGTFFTRSGVLQSVHAFSSSTLGPLLIGFFFVTVALGRRTARVARRPTALAGRRRPPALQRGAVHRQQRALRRLRRRRVARHRLPAPLRGRQRRAGDGRARRTSRRSRCR